MKNLLYKKVAKKFIPSNGIPIPLNQADLKIFREDIMKFDNSLPMNFLEFAGFLFNERIFNFIRLKKHPFDEVFSKDDLIDGF